MLGRPAGEWQPAGGTCKRIDFLSDLHLSPAMPRTTAAFTAYLSSSRADAVVILGDLFEVWVGDDARHDAWEVPLVEQLAHAARQRPLAFMAGNRDFLLGAAMLGATGMVSLPDPSIVSLHGQRLLLSHGDALCVDDRPTRRSGRWCGAPWQAEVLSMSLQQRRQLAADIRRGTRQRQAFDGAASADVDTVSATAWLRSAGAHCLVHGHTHRPGSHWLDVSRSLRRIVLSDWDLDDSLRPRAEVLVWDEAGPRRESPASASR